MIENIMTQSPFGSVAIHASIPLLEISKLFLSDLTYAVSSEVNLERAAGRKKKSHLQQRATFAARKDPVLSGPRQ